MEEFDDKIRRMVEGSDTKKPNLEDQEIQKILDVSKNWKTPEYKSKETSWNELEALIGKSDQISNKEQPNSNFFVKIAASLALLISCSVAIYFYLNQSTIVSTQVVEVKTFELPDGSTVILNALSSLEFNESNFKENRLVSLSGQAFFNVKKGKSFNIRTEDINTEVLGTSFNIYSRNAQVEVECITGKVRVSDDNNAFTLTKGEKVKSANNILDEKKFNFNLDKAISWTNGEFYYDNADLEIVLNEIEIQFDVNINGTGFDNRYYTGYFDNSNLDNALKQVLIPMGYTYDIKDKSIIVTQN